MIGSLKGRTVETSLETAIVDVGGVGYEVNCSTGTLAALELGEEARLWVHTHVREDAISLFGFATPVEKRLFLSLLKVTGVGPKLALKILSAASLDQLLDMIETGNVKALSGLPKVGKKTAEQLVLSLRGKLVTLDEAAKPSSPPKPARGFSGPRADVASALLNLGFRPQDVERVVEGLADDVDVEAGVRVSLRALSGGGARRDEGATA